MGTESSDEKGPPSTKKNEWGLRKRERIAHIYTYDKMQNAKDKEKSKRLWRVKTYKSNKKQKSTKLDARR